MLVWSMQEDTGQIMCQAQTGQALCDRGQGMAGIPAKTLPRDWRLTTALTHSNQKEGGIFSLNWLKHRFSLVVAMSVCL